MDKNMRILVAEDDLTTRTILTGILKKWNYDAIVVKDGQKAWEILQQPDSPRLVVLDWMMPKMSGLEVIQLVRARLVEQPPYIILLTSREEKASILSGLEAGANDYIKKPFDNEELNARIRVGQRSVDLQASLYETQNKLEHLATHDSMTGALNRRAILEQLSKEIARARRSRPQSENFGLSIGFLDIDHFKQINDQYGHQTGDDVLKEVVNILAGQLREYDSFGRLGGDEFLLVTPGIDLDSRENLYKRLIEAIANSKIKTVTGEVSITISMGVAMADADCNEDHLLSKADTAMYQAKREGGNCVVFAENKKSSAVMYSTDK
jgi:two-component system, cell cycle response regulator